MTIAEHRRDADRERLRQVLRQRLGLLPEPDGAQPPDAADYAGAYRDHVNGPLHRILQSFDLDRTYVHGEGLRLVDDQGRECLDFAGAYGALPFGHNPPSVWAAIDEVRRRGEPAFVQPSVLAGAAELAEALVGIAPNGLSHVTFANSGAEAVEAAVKLARSATGRLGILSTEHGFHGKTLGALSATGNHQYQQGFGAPARGFDTVPFADVDAVEAAFAHQRWAAFVVEPIQGEGGVNTPPPSYLRELRRLCDEHDVLLITDEVQTGLGRTGPMFAFERSGIVPDIVTVAKALGGGVLPIGAMLAKPALVTEHFALRHTSTFGGGGLATRVGLSVIAQLRQPDLQRNVTDRGAQLNDGLRRLAERWPQVISAVRGHGLLLGLELTDEIGYAGRQTLLGSLCHSENLAMAVASHLLHQHGIRVAPTLFGARVLRVEPALTVTERECERFLSALEATLALVAAGDAGRLLGHLVGVPISERPAPVTTLAPAPDDVPVWRPPTDAETRFAFVVHPLDALSIADFDESLGHWSDDQRQTLFDRFARACSVLNPAPFLVGSGAVISATGPQAHGELIGLPFTAEQLLSMPSDEATAHVRSAVDLAIERGAKIVGLGAYSSIVTANALALGKVDVPVTTGNSLTAAASVEAVIGAVRKSGRSLEELTVCVIRAGGAVGRAIAVALAPLVGRLVLVGRPAGTGSPRLVGTYDAIVHRLRPAAGTVDHRGVCPLTGTLQSENRSAGSLRLSDDAKAEARLADVVVTATSSVGVLLEAGDLKESAIVCDVAQPGNVPANLIDVRPDVQHFDGGIVRLPGDRDFGVAHGLPQGVTYACLAETALLALESGGTAVEQGLFSRGEDLDPGKVAQLGELARRHGFALAEARTWRG